MIKAKAPFVWVRYWQTKRVHLVEELSHAICGVSWVAGEAIDAADESEICKTCLKIARNRGLIEEVPEHTKPAQDPIKKQMHEYECRAKNAEDEVAEMRAKVERSKKREADTYAMFERENKKRVEAVRKVDDVEKENRRLKNSDRALLDTIAKIDREHAERVAGIEKDIDKMMPAYEAIEHVKDQRNQARSELVELRSQIIEIEKALDSSSYLNQDLLSATKGHTLENITTIMQAAPSAEDLEGYELVIKPLMVGDCYWNEVDKRWIVQSKVIEANISIVAFVRTPIIEYIPTEEITDALCEELGRIPCEVTNSMNSEWESATLVQVADPSSAGFGTLRSGGGGYWWKYCRIKRSTIESLRGSK